MRSFVLLFAAVLLAGTASGHEQGSQAGGQRCESARCSSPAAKSAATAQAEPSEAAKSSASPDAGDEIDVLVVYTALAASEADDIDVLIESAIADTNAIYERSAVETRLRLVHSYEDSSYEENFYMENNAWFLRRNGDGVLDTVHIQRDRYRADLVFLLVGGDTDWCDWTYFYPGTATSEAWAFGVMHHDCAILEHTHSFAVSAGFLQGARGNPEGGSIQIFAHGHAFCNAEEGWRTILSSDADGLCPLKIPYFSNPDVSYHGVPTGDVELRNNARVLNETAPIIANYRTREAVFTLPLVPGAGAIAGIQGFLRIHNRSDVDGEVTVYAIDDTAERFGPVTFEIAAGHTGGFNSEGLEDGNAERGLATGVGDGNGHWRLELVTELDIEARAYIRTSEGFLTSMHQVAREDTLVANRYLVPFFNPASNRSIVSRLRVVNPGEDALAVSIDAWDSEGEAGEGTVTFLLGAGAATLVSSQQLEAGDSDAFAGRLGDGEGKWRLEVSADGPLEVMSVLSTRSGHHTNVSR